MLGIIAAFFVVVGVIEWRSDKEIEARVLRQRQIRDYQKAMFDKQVEKRARELVKDMSAEAGASTADEVHHPVRPTVTAKENANDEWFDELYSNGRNR